MLISKRLIRLQHNPGPPTYTEISLLCMLNQSILYIPIYGNKTKTASICDQTNDKNNKTLIYTIPLVHVNSKQS